MEEFKDYNCVDQILQVDSKRALRVCLKTKEFGKLYSRAIVFAGLDQAMEKSLFESLADDVINEYEDRLKFYKAKK